MFFYPIKLLLFLAVVPGLFLAYRVYRMDKLEKEPLSLVSGLFVCGVLSIIPAAILENIGMGLISVFPYYSLTYAVLLNFVVIGIAEEGSKYIFLKRSTWNHPAFNYRFDGIVYAVSVGIGFAVFENIKYVMNFGLITALIRAVTAVPAHTIFAIFMGHYYGEAKRQERMGNPDACKRNLVKSLLVPILLHGFYDLTASSGSGILTLVFWIFLISLDIITIKRIRRDAAEDTEIW